MSNIITLEPITDLSNIESLRSLCSEALKSNEPIIKIDASQAERLKTPVFQLIVIFKNAVEKIGKKLVIDSPSEGFQGLAKSLGLWEMLTTN